MSGAARLIAAACALVVLVPEAAGLRAAEGRRRAPERSSAEMSTAGQASGAGPRAGADARNANDPRVGLKPGLRDAGEAALNLERIATLPKPDGFFDPKTPFGTPTPPERPPATPAKDAKADAKADTKPDTKPEAPTETKAESNAEANKAPGEAATTDDHAKTAESGGNDKQKSPRPFDPVAANRPGFMNTDMAFSKRRLIVGNYHGFNVYDVERAAKPRLLASIVCPGGQGDVSVHGRLLFLSVEQTRGRLDCGTKGVQTAVSTERFRGIRIFDISDVTKPKQIATVQTCRGSHTHTLVTDPRDAGSLYVYGSGIASVRSAEELAGCSGLDPKEDPNTALFSIDVIHVPLDAPQNARIVNRPRIFADQSTGTIAGLWKGGNHGEGTQESRSTNQCHDITVFPEVGLAAGACAGNGILLDISDPRNPVRIDQVVDKGFAYWHSATFNNDGTKVVFTDEWGGGSRPRCRTIDPPTWGANALFEVVDRKLRFASYYKLPAPQTEQENCVAHNGSLIPVPGRDIMVQAWYQGGLSVFDFTDSTKPVEIAFFDRGPLDAKQLYLGGYWSAYWYNGAIYASEIARGLDVFRLKPSDQLSQNEINAATLVWADELNTQQQTRVTWPAHPAVALAYVDQLTRSGRMAAGRAQEVAGALGRADAQRGGRSDSGAVRDELAALAAGLERDAGAVGGRDAARLRALASTLTAIGEAASRPRGTPGK